MRVEVEEIGACRRRLQVEESAEVVQRAWEQALARVQREARLPGFRKGKVPRSMVKLRFADDVRQEVARRLVPDAYRQALAEAKLRPVEEPEVQELTLEENAALTFSAVVEIKPTIELGEYTGLAVRHNPAALGADEVEQALTQLQEQHAEFRSVERAADLGDLVIVDYTLAVEGAEPRTETGYGFLVGSGSVLPEIDEAVIGLAAGGARSAPLRFPDDHRNEALRGRSGEARVTVIEVKEKVLPPLDDDFAKGLGAFDTLATLREEVQKGLEARRAQENRRALEDAVVEALLARHPFEVPEALVLRQVGHQIEHARERMRRQGLDPDRVPWDYRKLLDELRPGAERAVRRSLILEVIAERESLTPSEAEVGAEVERIAQASQRPAPAVRRAMEQTGDLEGLSLALREARTLDFLIQRAAVEG
jgi:trigger factor